jgi:hypothetical protein
MKKVIYSIGIFTLIMCIASACSTTSTLEKAREQQGKIVLNNLKHGGWEMNDIARSMELAVLEHQEKLKNSSNQAIVTTITCKIMSNCALAARTEAARIYAQQAGSFIRERITGDNNLDQTDLSTEFAKLYSGYEVLVQKEINGEVLPSFDVVRPAAGGAKEYKAFFIINEEKASQARAKAMERAFQETKLAQQYAVQIAAFVQEGFKITETE